VFGVEMFINSATILNKFVQLNGFGAPAQIGIDLTLKSVNKVHGGKLSIHGLELYKTYTPIDLNYDNYFVLSQGSYSLEFHQGIHLDDSHFGFVIHRSSINRLGARIFSAVYDPGFYCNTMGAFLQVIVPKIEIQYGARVAQLLVGQCESVHSKYDGNYQGEKDFK